MNTTLRKKSKVRWIVAALMWAAIAINYLDRAIIAAVSPALITEFSLTAEEMGWIMSGSSKESAPGLLTISVKGKVAKANAAPFAGKLRKVKEYAGGCFSCARPPGGGTAPPRSWSPRASATGRAKRTAARPRYARHRSPNRRRGRCNCVRARRTKPVGRG